MVAPSENPRQVKGISSDEGKQDNVLGNDLTAEYQKLNMSMGCLRLDSNKFSEITYSTHPESKGPPRLLMEGQVKSKGDDENMQGGPSRANVTQFILMFCLDCGSYVMVMKFNPECPICKSTNLMDLPQKGK